MWRYFTSWGSKWFAQIIWRCTVSPNEHYTTTKMWSRFTDSAEKYLNKHYTLTTTKKWCCLLTVLRREYPKVQEEMLCELMTGVYITYNSCECVCFDNELSMSSARTIIFMFLKHVINVCHVTGIIPLPCSHCPKISAVIQTGSPRLAISMFLTLHPLMSFRSSVPKCS